MDQNALRHNMQQFINAQQEAERRWREIETITSRLNSTISECHESRFGPLIKMTPQDDPEAFLKIFERVAQHSFWPKETWPLKLAPLLCGEAQLVYADLDDISAQSYAKVKEAILHHFRSNSDSYRQQFHSLKLLPGESLRAVAQKLNNLANKWLKPMETDKMKLFDKVVLGQFLVILPKEIQNKVQMQQPEDLESAIKFAEELSEVLSGTEEGSSHQICRLANDQRNSPTSSRIPDKIPPSGKRAAFVVNIPPRLQEKATSMSHDDWLLQQRTKKKFIEDCSPTVKKRRSTHENEDHLKMCYKMEDKSRDIISRMSEKLKDLSCTGKNEASFLEELKGKIFNLKRRNIYDEIFIGIFGKTGTGKSSLINALLNEICLLPTSSRQACTSCIVQVQAHENNYEYRAEIELISKEEWEEELKELVENCKEDHDLDDSDDGADTESESAKAKIKAVYGEDGLKKSFHELAIDKTNDILKSCRIIISEKTASQLSEKLSPYIRCDADDETHQSYWPLVKVVKIYVPKTCHLPSQVVLVDLPGTGDSNKERNKMWKEYISKCSCIWIVTEITRAESDRNTSEIFNTGLRGIAGGGECQNITIICTKTDEIGIPSDYKIQGISEQAGPSDECKLKREIIHQRNKKVKQNIIDKCNNKVKKFLFGSEENSGNSPIEVFTVSSKEYWNITQRKKNILTYEETGLPLLKEHLKTIYANQTKKAVENYVSEVSGIISFLNVPKENAEEKAEENEMLYCKLSKNLQTEIRSLASFFERVYKKLETELMQGVVNAEKECLKKLLRLLKPPRTNFSGYHQTIKALCRNSGCFRSYKGDILDLNNELASPIYAAVDNTLKSTFLFERNTRRNIKAALDLLQTNFQEDETFKGKKAAQSYRLVFIKTELKWVLAVLEKKILYRKKIIYNSIAVSIQDEMSPVYTG
ncbi:nuclear GTPase SLIP-GC-like isoform X2 [Polypterus senegalus]|uniref:nuclear GTPase SLIP-GC-like isoform X2 n=1 Tax=Polypterus senegalus TaxID=55291 RepID=UPI0019636830|nr:nuclear GTPase SLIP-GC-like isoform X2 [Polypterus senegalus]